MKDIEALIIGANGLVGAKLGKLLTDKGIEWIGSYNKRAKQGLIKLDITNSKEVKDVFSEYKPKVVFHCANLAGGVNFAESNPKIATNFYLEATKSIGIECKKIDAFLVLISTDYIFDGTNPPYKEEDVPNPLNLYGKVKLASEEWMKANLDKYVIVRTTNVYGWDPETVTPNYIMQLFRSLKEGKRFKAPSFLWGNPTYVGDLAEAIIELYQSDVKGIFNIVGSTYVNRYEWAKKICETLELDSSLIDEFQKPPANIVPRPLKSNLNTDKFKSSYKTVLHDLKEGLTLMKKDMELSLV